MDYGGGLNILFQFIQNGSALVKEQHSKAHYTSPSILKIFIVFHFALLWHLFFTSFFFVAIWSEVRTQAEWRSAGDGSNAGSVIMSGMVSNTIFVKIFYMEGFLQSKIITPDGIPYCFPGLLRRCRKIVKRRPKCPRASAVFEVPTYWFTIQK